MNWDRTEREVNWKMGNTYWQLVVVVWVVAVSAVAQSVVAESVAAELFPL